MLYLFINSEQQDIEERKKDAIKRIDGVIANLFWRNNRSFIVSYFKGKDSYNYITHTDFCIRTKIVCINGLKFQMYAIWSKDLAAFQIFKTENELLDYMKKNHILPNTWPPNELCIAPLAESLPSSIMRCNAFE